MQDQKRKEKSRHKRKDKTGKYQEHKRRDKIKDKFKEQKGKDNT